MAGLSVLMVLGGLSCSSAAGQGNPTPVWKLTWTDSFNGQADSGVNPKYWEYNTGRGVFGTNEVETMTNSTSTTSISTGTEISTSSRWATARPGAPRPRGPRAG